MQNHNHEMLILAAGGTWGASESTHSFVSLLSQPPAWRGLCEPTGRVPWRSPGCWLPPTTQGRRRGRQGSSSGLRRE